MLGDRCGKALESPRLVAERVTGTEYEIEHHGDRFIIKTNIGGAEDYKIVTAPVSDPSPKNWVDLVPHRPGIFIVSYTVFANWMVRLERENALPRFVVRNMTTGEEHAIAFAEEAYSLAFGDMREYDTDTLRFIYSSPTTPSQVFDYDMKTRERVLRKTQEVPSGHDPDAYVARRLLAPSHDGEEIPVTLLYRKDTTLDGSAPLWLYGYGSYGISMPSSFNTNILSLVNRRFRLRNGPYPRRAGEGPALVQDGQARQEGEQLPRLHLRRRISRVPALHHPPQHRGQGGSAGGLLMGAVANMAPDLFKGIVAEVPFVDALTTMLDDTLPLTPPEWPNGATRSRTRPPTRRLRHMHPMRT